MTCSCKQRGSKGTRFTPIDPTGHHLVSGCNIQSMRTDISNRVEKEIPLCDIAKWCGLHVVRQEVGCFKECDPNGKNLRPDISISNAEEVDSSMTEIAHWLWMSKLRIPFLVRKVAF